MRGVGWNPEKTKEVHPEKTKEVHLTKTKEQARKKRSGMWGWSVEAEEPGGGDGEERQAVCVLWGVGLAIDVEGRAIGWDGKKEGALAAGVGVKKEGEVVLLDGKCGDFGTREEVSIATDQSPRFGGDVKEAAALVGCEGEGGVIAEVEPSEVALVIKAGGDRDCAGLCVEVHGDGVAEVLDAEGGEAERAIPEEVFEGFGEDRELGEVESALCVVVFADGIGSKEQASEDLVSEE